MMRRAGKAAADFLIARTRPDARIVLLAGPGNNGGDAFVCAMELAAKGYAPRLVVLGDPVRLPPDAKAAWDQLRTLRADVWQGLESAEQALPQAKAMPAGDVRSFKGRVRVALGFDGAPITADWIVDGLFGIGLKRPLDAACSRAVHATARAREAGAKVLSLDVPSGIDADTGALIGNVTVSADHTLTFIARKPGLMTGPALDHVGELHLASLGLDLDSPASAVSTFGFDDARALMRPAAANAHKGTHGTLAIVGGAQGMLGAALLASRAAMRMGAGKVKVAWLANPHPQVDPPMPEVMMRAALDGAEYADCTALVVGCGMGQEADAKRLLASLLKRDLPLLLDADALNLIAASRQLQALVAQRSQRATSTVITPHPAEAARLLGISAVDVQNDRLRASRELATRLNCVAVVKGAGTVVDDGQTTTINTTGNPLLATSGTGDVLAGVIGALLAQGYPAADAARMGVAFHGAAADALATRGIRRAVAGDVIAELAAL